MTACMKIRLLLIAAITLLTAAMSQAAVRPLSNEQLYYNVMFKWGLINKKAGHALVTLKPVPASDTYRATVIAASEPWADRIFPLRDTLTTEISRATLAPVRYERRAHENGRYENDVVIFTRSGDQFSAECVHRKKGKKDTEIKESTTTLEAIGMTVDFVSAFYYLRELDFSTMLPGTSVTINIFSGRRKELLRFTYKGIDTIKLNDRKQNAYKVEFTFTSDGKKETSDPITAWISIDDKRLPLLIEGKLPIGKVRCELRQ